MLGISDPYARPRRIVHTHSTYREQMWRVALSGYRMVDIITYYALKAQPAQFGCPTASGCLSHLQKVALLSHEGHQSRSACSVLLSE